MKPTSKLTEEERGERDRLETVVSNGVQSFVEVGNALLEIAEKRLYRETHGSFEPYCREKWGMTARRAYQLCEAAKVVQTVNNCSQIRTESQAREIGKVPPDSRDEVLRLAGHMPTAREIRQAARTTADAASKPTQKPEILRGIDMEKLSRSVAAVEATYNLEMVREDVIIILEKIQNADFEAEDLAQAALELRVAAGKLEKLKIQLQLAS